LDVHDAVRRLEADPVGPQRKLVLVAAVALCGIGAVAAVAMRGSGDGASTVSLDAGGDVDDQGAVGVAPTTTAVAVTTTATTLAPPTTTTTTTTAAARPVTTTATPTTAARRTPTFEMSPTSGPRNTRVTLSGAGCQGADHGVAVAMYDANGDGFNGDGGAALPDGTWRLEVSIGVGPSGPGDYTIRADCQHGGTVVFSYAPRTFTQTG
jgi:hypothetical protein